MKWNQLVLSAFTVSICLLNQQANAQAEPCAFDRIHTDLLRSNVAYKKAISLNEEKVSNRLLAEGSKTLGTVYKIPVVVHVIHKGEAVGTGTNISDAQIQSALTSLTQYYRGTLGSSVDTEIEFVLAKLNETCNATTGIVRINGSGITNYVTSGLVTGTGGNEQTIKDISRWSPTKYYNIWIVSEINGNDGGAGIQGFAYFPGAPATLDGAVMLYNAFGYDPSSSLGYNLKSYTNRNTVATHELGHALGLYHSFQGDDANEDGVVDGCPSNTSCTTEGDMVCDTDPHQRSVSNCPSGSNTCTGSALGTIVNNYMDYSSQTCQNRFTAGQVARMRAFLEQTRVGLTSSMGSNNVYPFPAYTAPVAATCTPATSTTGLSAIYAGLMNVGLNGSNFSSSYASGDGGYVNGATCMNLVQLYTNTTYTFSATVYAFNREQVRAWIDYNNNGSFENTEEIFYANNIANSSSNYITVSGNFTVPPSATTNANLRLRVTDELGTTYGSSLAITGGCYAPNYGQTEDYVVRIGSVLAVDLTTFSGQSQNGQSQLRWTTAQEMQSASFDVERSFDGIEYNRIGTVAASGNSSSEKSYSFTDTRPAAVNYYRLKMIDRDGRSERSNVVVIKNSGTAQGLLLNENPFVSTISFSLAREARQLKLQLINAVGAVVAEKKLDGRSQRVNWPISSPLASGTYFLQVIADGESFTEKMIRR